MKEKGLMMEMIKMSNLKERKLVVIKPKTTYMEFPNHSLLWAQWTSETKNLGTGRGKINKC